MDITNPTLLKLKGLLFLLLGLMSGGCLLALFPEWQTLLLLVICVWSFCRFYYFAFYVLEHYADPTFRYAGMLDLLKYLWHHKQSQPEAKILSSETDRHDRKDQRSSAETDSE